ncbi:MAG: sodium:solute symporter family protein [Marinilabiliaceae bacterium]|nr:sodium:solute symporter family protein [Marinilabiliaceae bacterium]
MTVIDFVIIAIYLAVVLYIGYYFHKRNKGAEDFYVGGRNMSKWHLGLSVVATDVGGGFSIGLGGLGFTMGLAGSWLLFSGLVGAWVAAVILIPKVYSTAKLHRFLTFPELLKHHYGSRIALWAGIISAIGYIGFTGSQVLAGAKLTAATIDGLTFHHAVFILGAVAIIYTAMGGIKAVIYTDTIQWIILLSGLLFIGVPFALIKNGGWTEAMAGIPMELKQLTNISWSTMVNWMFTIIPIWFIGMTLYQRIYAAKSEQEAKKAWFIAGLFEYPIMAMLGVFLGLMARVSLGNGLMPGTIDGIDPESAMPQMLKYIIPTGALGLILAAYFSAILSTADSCLMAASGNIISDVLRIKGTAGSLKLVQLATFLIGGLSIAVALLIPSVLELMLLAYAFMVSGLFIPVLGFLFFTKPSKLGAGASMITGASTMAILEFAPLKLPYALSPVVFSVFISLLAFLLFQLLSTKRTE